MDCSLNILSNALVLYLIYMEQNYLNHKLNHSLDGEILYHVQNQDDDHNLDNFNLDIRWITMQQ